MRCQDETKNMLTLFNFYITDKKLTPLYPLKNSVHRCNSAATQLCCNYPWSPKGRKNIHRGDQRKNVEKKIENFFFLKHFLMKKFPGYMVSIQRKKIVRKKIYNTKNSEKSTILIFWPFFCLLSPKLAQYWSKISSDYNI
jgi:hypothetical protein